jgi:hypothetical protein
MFLELIYSLKRTKEIKIQSLRGEDKDLRGRMMSMIRSLNAVERITTLVETFDK